MRCAPRPHWCATSGVPHCCGGNAHDVGEERRGQPPGIRKLHGSEAGEHVALCNNNVQLWSKAQSYRAPDRALVEQFTRRPGIEGDWRASGMKAACKLSRCIDDLGHIATNPAPPAHVKCLKCLRSCCQTQWLSCEADVHIHEIHLRVDTRLYHLYSSHIFKRLLEEGAPCREERVQLSMHATSSSTLSELFCSCANAARPPQCGTQRRAAGAAAGELAAAGGRCIPVAEATACTEGSLWSAALLRVVATLLPRHTAHRNTRRPDQSECRIASDCATRLASRNGWEASGQVPHAAFLHVTMSGIAQRWQSHAFRSGQRLGLCRLLCRTSNSLTSV